MNILTPARVKTPIPGAWILQFQNGKGPSGLHNYEYSFSQKCRSRKDFEKLFNLGQFCQSLVSLWYKSYEIAIYDPLITQRCIIPTLKRTNYIRSPEWLRWTKNPATSTSWSQDDFFELLQHNFHKTTYIITFILRMKLMRKADAKRYESSIIHD